MCDADEFMFVKPCTQAEIDFYESLRTPEHSRMAEIVPLYIGNLATSDANPATVATEKLSIVAENISPEVKDQVLELLGGQDVKEAVRSTPNTAPAPAAAATPKPAAPVDNVTWIPNANRKIPTHVAVALENAAYGFKRPNIMDVKLGKRLWADDAPLEKKRRFDKISAETTHHDLGFRIAGMRVYKGCEDATELDEEDYKIYDKDYGRHDVTKDNVVDAFRGFLYNINAGIDDEYARAVADAFRRDLEHVRDVLESEESRMYSTSLLFIFEGEGEALKAAIDERSGSTVSSVKGKKTEDSHLSEYPQLPGRSTSRIDSGIGLDDDGEIVYPGGVGDAAALDLDDDDEEEELPKIWNLKLIDFAHAIWTPGMGPDENILLGVRSLIKIFEELSQ